MSRELDSKATSDVNVEGFNAAIVESIKIYVVGL